MNIKLPVFISNLYFLFQSRQEDIVVLSCFLIPILLIVYYITVLSEYDEYKFYLGKSFFKKKNRKVEIGREVTSDIERNAYGEALKILDRARADSLKILGQAQVKAQGLLDNSYSISRENKRKLEENLHTMYEKQEKVLDNLSEELLEYYREAIEEGKRENIRTLYEVTQAMRKEALQGVDELKDVVKKETIGAQDALEEKITTEYAKIDSEIKEYKSNKVEALNKRIFELLSNIHSDVLKEDLDQIKHEKLILELLKREISKSGLKSS